MSLPTSFALWALFIQSGTRIAVTKKLVKNNTEINGFLIKVAIKNTITNNQYNLFGTIFN